jgi:hypothetical protein
VKTLTAVAILWLAVGVCWAETVTDNAGKDWTCRVPDGTIYAKYSSGDHLYNIQAARNAREADSKDHGPICINPMKERLIWSWPNATHIKVSFTPLTKDGGVCEKSSQPFLSAPGDSGNYNFIVSDVADRTYSYCTYELSFTSSLGKEDPHIIIKGSGLVRKLEELTEEIRRLETELQEVKKDLEHLEKEQEKDSKHQQDR